MNSKGRAAEHPPWARERRFEPSVELAIEACALLLPAAPDPAAPMHIVSF
jgi:hypothetical protein